MTTRTNSHSAVVVKEYRVQCGSHHILSKNMASQIKRKRCEAERNLRGALCATHTVGFSIMFWVISPATIYSGWIWLNTGAVNSSKEIKQRPVAQKPHSNIGKVRVHQPVMSTICSSIRSIALDVPEQSPVLAQLGCQLCSGSSLLRRSVPERLGCTWVQQILTKKDMKDNAESNRVACNKRKVEIELVRQLQRQAPLRSGSAVSRATADQSSSNCSFSFSMAGSTCGKR